MCTLFKDNCFISQISVQTIASANREISFKRTYIVKPRASRRAYPGTPRCTTRCRAPHRVWTHSPHADGRDGPDGGADGAEALMKDGGLQR